MALQFRRAEKETTQTNKQKKKKQTKTKQTNKQNSKGKKNTDDRQSCCRVLV